MSSTTAFITTPFVSGGPVALPTKVAAITASPLCVRTVPSRRSTLRMNNSDYKIGVSEYQDTPGDDDEMGGDGSYRIQKSEFSDMQGEDDCGDGFMGESDMDDLLGVAMPEDLASFEKREIQNTQSREELVAKLSEIAQRRRGILHDKRKGIGMDNVNNYLDIL